MCFYGVGECPPVAWHAYNHPAVIAIKFASLAYLLTSTWLLHYSYIFVMLFFIPIFLPIYFVLLVDGMCENLLHVWHQVFSTQRQVQAHEGFVCVFSQASLFLSLSFRFCVRGSQAESQVSARTKQGNGAERMENSLGSCITNIAFDILWPRTHRHQYHLILLLVS